MQRSAYGQRNLALLSQLLSAIPVKDQDEPSMTVSELNGFLVGIATSPDPVALDTWLPCVWGGGQLLHVTDLAVPQLMINAIIHHYNAIARQLHDTWSCELIFQDYPQDEHTRWEPWVSGFELSLALAPDGWERLMSSSDEDASAALSLVLALHAIDMGESTLTEAQLNIFNTSAPELLPHAVEAFHRWRHKRDPFSSRLLLKKPDAETFTRPRNVVKFPDTTLPKHLTGEGCRCGSGRRYFRCCGAN